VGHVAWPITFIIVGNMGFVSAETTPSGDGYSEDLFVPEQ
jgi:hypothetical protein